MDQQLFVGSQNMITAQVSITTGAAQILLARRTTGTRSDVTLLNMDDTNIVYIGGRFMPDGTTPMDDTNGYPLAAGASITRRFQGDIYCYAPTATVKVALITDEDNS